MANNIKKTIDATVSHNWGDDVGVMIPNITNRLIERLFAVCNAELTSKPLVFQAKNPKIRPETKISNNPKVLYP